MKRILIINPNTTTRMTDKVACCAKKLACADTEIVAVTSARGPASIEGYYDGALAVPGLLSAIQENLGFDAVIIACFDDTGLDAARCVTDKPVIGIGEAAYHVASMLSNKFSVITTLGRSVPILEDNLLRYGMAKKCVRVRSTEIPVLALENESPESVELIATEIEKSISDDRAEAIVLGCAGMTNLAESLAIRFSLPVLDGVACAIAMCEGLIRLNIRTSRLGGYAQQKTD